MEKFTLMQYYEHFYAEQSQRVGKDLAHNTLKTYRNRKSCIAQYLQENSFLSIMPDQLTIRMIRSFDVWLRAKKGYCNDYVVKHIQLLERMMDFALENEDIQKNPCIHYRYNYDRRKRRIYLDLTQLTQLKHFILPNEDLIRNRDLFLFACYTGFSYSEIRNFQTKNIFTGIDGRDWINIIRQKTKKTEYVTLLPMLSGAMDILEKYGYRLPVSSNGKMNKCLKRISKLSGINIPLCTHAGRKTFGNVLVNDFGVDIKTVSVMMGHKNIKTTEDWYVDIRPQKIMRDMVVARAANW